MGALVLEGLGGLTGEAIKSVGVGASELMLHFPYTAKKVPQIRLGYPDWAGKCNKLIPKLIPELGPSALAHLSGHPVLGVARQRGNSAFLHPVQDSRICRTLVQAQIKGRRYE